MDTYLEKLDIPAIDYTTGIHVDYPKGIQQKNLFCRKNFWKKTV